MAGDGVSSDTPRRGIPLWLGLRPRALWRLALGLMIADGALALVASVSPWALARATPFFTALGFGPFSLDDPALTALGEAVLAPPAPGLLTPAFIVKDAVISAGLLLYAGLGAFIGVALLFRLPRRVKRGLLLVDAVWLATLLGRLIFCTALLAVGARGVFSSINSIGDGVIASIAPAQGYWLAWLAALLGVASLVCAWRAFHQSVRR